MSLTTGMTVSQIGLIKNRKTIKEVLTKEIMLSFRDFLEEKRRKLIVSYKGSPTTPIDIHQMHQNIDNLYKLIDEFENDFYQR